MLLKGISIESEHQAIVGNFLYTQTLKSVFTYVVLPCDIPSRNIIVRVRMAYVGFLPL